MLRYRRHASGRMQERDDRMEHENLTTAQPPQEASPIPRAAVNALAATAPSRRETSRPSLI